MPVVGFLNFTSPDGFEDRLRAFRQGLRDTGYVEGVNVAIEYRWAGNQFDQLPALATELVRRQVAVIAAASTTSALAAKAATATIPIVFVSGADPVRVGLVSNLARPDGNLTGISFVASELTAKRLELLRELVRGANRIAVLVNPANAELAETTLKDIEHAAHAMGVQIQIFNATTGREIDAVFANLGRDRPDALFVGGDPLFASRRVQLANLSARHAIAMTSGTREVCRGRWADELRDEHSRGLSPDRCLRWSHPQGSQASGLAGRPGEQSSSWSSMPKTAQVLDLEIPPTLLARADEVIE